MVERFARESGDPAAFRARVNRFRSQDRTARMTGEVEKEGFDTGRKAINPFTGAARSDLDRQLRAGRIRHRRRDGCPGPR